MEPEVRGVPGAAALGDSPARGDERASALLAADAEASIGAYLRTQRQLREIGLAELASVTRIPRRSLERLEAGEFDARPDGFVRSFVRAVAMALGLDPDDTVARMLAEPAEAPGPRSRPAGGAPFQRLVALALVLAALSGAAAWWALGSAGAPGGAGAEVPVVWRRDPVRALAESVAEGAEPGAAPEAAPGHAPEPPPPPGPEGP